MSEEQNPTNEQTDNPVRELDAMKEIFDALLRLTPEGRVRALNWAVAKVNSVSAKKTEWPSSELP